MDFWNVLLLSQPAPVASGPSASWPLTGIGVETNWAITTTGGTYWNLSPGPYIIFDGADAGDTAALTGAAKTSFDAAWPNSTMASLTLKQGPDAGGAPGTVSVAAKGGTAVNYAFTGAANQTVTHNVTSGAGSGFVVTQVTGGGSFYMYDIDVP